MMTTTYGKQQISGHDNYYAPQGTQGPVWPVAFNPYIELAASHPITTNCMNCHHRAAWPPSTPATKPDRGRFSAYLQNSPPNPNALEVFQPSSAIFNGLLMVDAMWAVSDRAGYALGTQTAAEAAKKAESAKDRENAGSAVPCSVGMSWVRMCYRISARETPAGSAGAVRAAEITTRSFQLTAIPTRQPRESESAVSC